MQGELITFEDAEQRLPRLDWLEGYLQGDAPYPYERVLVWALGEEGEWVPAWVYVWPRVPPDGTLVPEGRWEPGDEVDRLKEIDCPALVLVGEQDTGTPPEMARAIHEHLRGSELRVIPSAAHLSNVEQARVFNEALLDFLSRADQRERAAARSQR
ncbi:MAG: alpha/beta hydrolase [Chloroflexi bacterium]|nr:alpha/beta hydrolase [Chloroflexota bacterium]